MGRVYQSYALAFLTLVLLGCNSTDNCPGPAKLPALLDQLPEVSEDSKIRIEYPVSLLDETIEVNSVEGRNFVKSIIGEQQAVPVKVEATLKVIGSMYIQFADSSLWKASFNQTDRNSRLTFRVDVGDDFEYYRHKTLTCEAFVNLRAQLVEGHANDVRPVDIDGEFEDWSVAISTVDPTGDASGKFDVSAVSSVRDGDVLYAMFQLMGGEAVTLQNGEESDGTLQMIVSDGTKKLTVDFRGRMFFTNERAVSWDEIGFRCLPTYASNRYELKLSVKDFDHDKLTIDFAGSDSLRLPYSAKTKLDGSKNYQQIDVAKDPNVFRIANLNTLDNGLVDKQRGPIQHRLLAHVNADVYTFQEEWEEPMFNRAVPELSKALGTELGTVWFGGCAIASRLPLEKLPMTLDRAVAGLVTQPDGTRVAVISVHLKSRGYFGSQEDALRLQQAEQIVGELKKMRAGEFGEGAREAGVIVVGDYNLVGSETPLRTMIDAGLVDLICKNPANGEATTWRGDSNSSFWPGRLDLLCYGPKLVPVKGWVFDSATYSKGNMHGIVAEDSASSDHLMLIGDFETTVPETAENLSSDEIRNREMEEVIASIGKTYGIRTGRRFIGKCVKILDGDTVEIQTRESETVTVHLVGIDAPEIGQSFSDEAIEMLSEMIGRVVCITTTGVDEQGEIVGFMFDQPTVVFDDEDNPTVEEIELVMKQAANQNHLLLRKGLAWYSYEYSASEKLAEVERRAREGKEGLWADEDVVAPWVWRRRARNAFIRFLPEPVKAVPEYRRWKMEYIDTNLDVYAKQLSFFKIDIGAVSMETNDIDRIVDPGGTIRVIQSERSQEKRSIYFINVEPKLVEWESKLVLDAGSTMEGRNTVLFYPDETKEMLRRIEADYLRSNGIKLAKIRRTFFKIEETAGGFKFVVSDVEFRN